MALQLESQRAKSNVPLLTGLRIALVFLGLLVKE